MDVVLSTDPDKLSMGEEGPVRFDGTDEPRPEIIELKDKGKAIFLIKFV